VLRDDGASYLGPFASRRTAEQALTAVYEAVPIRQCTARLSVRRRTVSACVLAEMGRCGAPCEGREAPQDYAVHVAAVRAAMFADARALVATLGARVEALAVAERFEDAAAARDRLAAFIRAAARMQRLGALTRCPEVVAARPTADLGWELIVVRRGRLAAAAICARGQDPRPAVDALRATAETVPAGPGPIPAASAEETECVLRWLEEPGVRLVHLEGTWASPCHGAGAHREWGEAARRARLAVAPFEDRRPLRTVPQPAGLP
jgi:DNA polymerase-3 subunit epsilon